MILEEDMKIQTEPKKMLLLVSIYKSILSMYCLKLYY